MMLERFEQVRQQALEELKQVEDLTALEAFRIKYLGRKGLVTQLLSQIGALPREDKPKAGQLANQAKRDVTAAFEGRQKTLKAAQKPTGEFVDVTLPGRLAIRVDKVNVADVPTAGTDRIGEVCFLDIHVEQVRQ